MTTPRNEFTLSAEAPIALIVGAGIGGLAAGIALGRAGWRVRIFERASNPRELGFALNLAPNAVAALSELGLADRIGSLGHVVTSAELREPGHGVLKHLDVESVSDRVTPTVVASRQALHGTLLEAVGRDALELDSAVEGFEQMPTGVTLRCANGTTADGDVLIGADGVNSVIRARLHRGEAAPRTTRYVALRALSRGSAGHMQGLSSIAYLGRGLETAAVQTGGGDVYWYMSLLASDVAPARIPCSRTRVRARRKRSKMRWRWDSCSIRDRTPT
jgi:2-polyprenyl-6-methoxyphenol hydroxylase-like FAD-dependent oxidoreductase